MINHDFIFESLDDRNKFMIESELSFESVKIDETTELKFSVDEEAIILKRTEKKKRLKDFRKSKLSKKSWRINRKKLEKGIKKFHRSTKGKRFHRALGRRLATREVVRQNSEMLEFLVGVQSLKTHLTIGTKYASSIDEEVDYLLFYESIVLTIIKLEEKLSKSLISCNYNFNLTTEESVLLNDLILNITEDGELSD